MHAVSLESYGFHVGQLFQVRFELLLSVKDEAMTVAAQRTKKVEIHRHGKISRTLRLQHLRFKRAALTMFAVRCFVLP